MNELNFRVGTRVFKLPGKDIKAWCAAEMQMQMSP